MRALPLVIIALVLMSPARVARPLAQGVDVESRRSEMRDHYSHLVAVHDAVVRGDLDAIRGPATELAYFSVPINSPPGASAFGTTRASAYVQLLSTCADCHRKARQ